MAKNSTIKYIFWLTALGAGCREPYEPPATKSVNNFLVVDGFINGGNDSTFITLTRTRSLEDTVPQIPELHAHVSVEGEISGINPLQDLGNGLYSIDHLNISITEKCRLKITTSDGKEYISDYVPFKQTPPIDSVVWKQDNNPGVTIYINTHDPQNNTIYYRWTYNETWKYRSFSDAELDWVNGTLIIRDPIAGHVYYCYSSNNSTNITIGTSQKLGQDIISESPIISIENGSEKISEYYSILISQYALTEDAFNYWTNLKKNTEQLGTLFDAQPSQINGNIRCVTTPSEPVLGYVSASTKESKRIFIDNFNLVDWHYAPYFNNYNCSKAYKIVPTDDSMNYWFSGPGPYPYTLIKRPIPPIGYIVLPTLCADCRFHGGTVVKPPFWP
jgi:hypothetical protein